MKTWFKSLMLMLSLVLITSCNNDDDNSWRDKNEKVFSEIGKLDVVTVPKIITLYGETVRDTTINININKNEVKEFNGIKYRVLHKSTNTERPLFTSTVKVNYDGWMINGTVFDTTYGPNSAGPMQTIVNGGSIGKLVRGWTEALQLMSEGDIFEVYIPWDLAYGSQKNGSIPAYSMLVFKLELLQIVEK